MTRRDDYDPNDPLKGATTCPHCGGYAKISPHPELRFVCNICGAPRIEIDAEGYTLSGREKKHLLAARAAQKGRLGWRLGGFLGGATAAAGLALTALVQLIFSPGLWWAGLGITLALPFILLAITAVRKSRAKGETLDEELDEAWKSAARDVIASTDGSLTAERLTEILPLSQADAEELSAELAVDEMVHSRVTDDGHLALSSSTKVRIDEGARPDARTLHGDDPLEARFEALEEALAAEEAQKARAKQGS